MDRIMVVDDEKDMVYMIKEFMKVYNIDVVTAYSGEAALLKFDDTIDLILLDINMEKLNGIEVCKNIRQKSSIPIVFITSNSSQYDKILGLGVGADDYITKPFDPIELVARVKAHIRRYKEYSSFHENKNEIIEFGDIRIICSAHRVLKKGKEINLTSTEYNLLIYLIKNPNKVLTRKDLLLNVWKSQIYDENTVTTYIKRLREKIEDDKNSPKYIKSVRSIGYIFEADINIIKIN